MHTFYDSNHHLHDPAALHHAGTPERNVYYSEVAQRGTQLQRAVQAARLGPIVEPSDFGMKPIADVHDPHMLALLQSAFEQHQRQGHTGPVLPDTFLSQAQPRRKPFAIQGQLGMYCFDVGAPIFSDTWQAAYQAAQTALSAAAWTLIEGNQSAYALCRPPGHHAGAHFFGGYCYLNNAAIAANWLAQQDQRVALLDVDYHHGNGTQDIFYGRSDVLVCSIHADPQYDYPYYWGFAEETGAGAGVNANLNFPLPPHSREQAYMTAYNEALLRIRQFAPDILVVSLGVDTAVDDPQGHFHLTPPAFMRMGAKLAAFDLPTVIVQEGGYHLATLGECVVAFLRGVRGA